MKPAMTSQAAHQAGNSDGPWTVRRVLEWTVPYLQENGSDAPRLEAEILLAHARGCPRIQLYTQFDEPLSDDQRNVMRDLVRRRASHEPVAYLVGYREFYGIEFHVTPDVLIPRPDTETLVLELIELARGKAAPRILDIGTGSGCIAIAAAVNLPNCTVAAVDISERALEIAKSNATRHGVDDRIDFRSGSLFEPIADDRYDFVVSNPPYVVKTEIDTLQIDVCKYEPRLALDGGGDGLDVLRQLVNHASRYLTPGGHILYEMDSSQSDALCEMISADGAYEGVRVIPDLAGRPRVVHAHRKAD